jgi:hypothetical protein
MNINVEVLFVTGIEVKRYISQRYINPYKGTYLKRQIDEATYVPLTKM